MAQKRNPIGLSVGQASSSERERARMEQAAIDLLEGPLRRRRWVAADKDAVTDFLVDLVRKETRRRVIGGNRDERDTTV